MTFEGKRYPLSSDGETVLEALLRGGANVPFSCRRGTCHTCVMKAVEGEPPDASLRGLRGPLRAAGYFLPCLAVPERDLTICRPNPSELSVRMHVHDRALLSPRVLRLRLEPETNFVWRAAQFVNVRHPFGESRSYSLACGPDDYFLELHIGRHEHGLVSGWLFDEVSVGDVLEVEGPHGACCYGELHEGRPLLLLGTGTGLAPLLAVAVDALSRGHAAPIHLYHGARSSDALYHRERLDELARRHENFHYTVSVSGGGILPPGTSRGRCSDLAFGHHTELLEWGVFLAGNPEMVHDARYRAFRAGAQPDLIHADPFESSRPFLPDDAAKLGGLAPDPELWAALQGGPGLRQILTDFYQRVYADGRLSPFFHNVTAERAIDKQYSFLADVFAGTHDYFGLKPFNAHHWMIISDELFDYRERLLESCMQRYGLAPHLIRRWRAVHELFRREIVKASARGLVIDGVEQRREGFREERLDVACVCDGCGRELAAGTTVRLLLRGGQLFCSGCAAHGVGATLPPAPESRPPDAD